MIVKMVIIAIIAILAALLLPALRKARGKAYDVACKNKLKQIGFAMVEYSSEFEDWILPSSMGGSKYWIMVLSGMASPATVYSHKYGGLSHFGNTETKGSFHCPTEAVKFGPSADGLFQYTHYTKNNLLCGSIGASPSGSQRRDIMRKLSHVKRPSETVSVGDSIQRNDYSANYVYAFSYRHGVYDSRPKLAVAGMPPYSNANILYMDGHVEGKIYQWLKTPNCLTTGYDSGSGVRTYSE